ncbi:hypothetical protein DYB28_004981 [Aphanomyces astaci]|uniref:Uncharacterized protein n=2 Tax=Aphanomyces astaci TaxID=112090 RepID=A0A397ETH3_APHAT|nr:hypothetical protein DYB31_008069 [Aphanomyces astaci]RHZ12760.1 hypothetical protein DYB26_002297 [Aphanomyces astaci]RLN99856.1 hypothetical protein DYB28_004981 [Aphanomyces astaci]
MFVQQVVALAEVQALDEQPCVFVVEDARADDRFADAPGRFFYGLPLVALAADKEVVLGVVEESDPTPRTDLLDVHHDLIMLEFHHTVDFDMDESDLLFGNNEDSHSNDDDRTADEDGTASGSDLDDDIMQQLPSRATVKPMAGLAIPTGPAVHTTAPALMRSRSMPNTANFMSSNEQKWRVKYLSALKLPSTAVAVAVDEKTAALPSPSVLNNIPRHSKASSALSPSVRSVRTRKMSSEPIGIPAQQLSQSLSNVQHLDWRRLESSERYQRNLNQYELDDHRGNHEVLWTTSDDYDG